MLVAANAYAIDGVSDYSETYDVSYKGLSVGSGTLSVRTQENADNSWDYTITVEAQSSGLAKLIGGHMQIYDHATGKWDNGNWYPKQFSHEETDDDGTKSETIYFNWGESILTSNKDGHVKTHSLKQGTIDYGTTFIALQNLASQGCVSKQFYQLASDKITPVQINCSAETRLSGVNTYKYEAINEDRGFIAWMRTTPPHDLIQFTATKDGKSTISLSK